jgi:hypothetical protein
MDKTVGRLACSVVADVLNDQDSRVLKAIVGAFEDLARYKMSPERIEQASGVSLPDVLQALRGLLEADPPYILGTTPPSDSYSIRVEGITERARIAVGRLPTPEVLVDSLVSALEQAGDTEEDESVRVGLKKAAETLGTSARQIAALAIASAITRA